MCDKDAFTAWDLNQGVLLRVKTQAEGKKSKAREENWGEWRCALKELALVGLFL